jgi:hypothetical protein
MPPQSSQSSQSKVNPVSYELTIISLEKKEEEDVVTYMD